MLFAPYEMSSASIWDDVSYAALLYRSNWRYCCPLQYKENETLYFQRVPAAVDLAPPAPALLVAAVPPPPELDQPAEKWFAFLSGVCIS